MHGYLVGILGMGVLCDGISSLYTYTSKERASGQSWKRDHSLRIIRCLVGISLIVLGAMIDC